MGGKPRDELGLSADALRMRSSIEQRLFGPQLPLRRDRRRHVELGAAHVRAPRRSRMRALIAVLVIVAIVIALLVARA